jgi:uncharacterized phage-associated protein
MIYNVFDISNKILAKPNESDYDDLISNMKLQKLLYYQQGYHLAYFDSPLFDEDVEAWWYGPVVPVVYDKYKHLGKDVIKYTGETVLLTDEEERLFDKVYGVYGQYSALGLSDLTHGEKPWRSVEPGKGHVIPKESLTKFFKHELI